MNEAMKTMLALAMKSGREQPIPPIIAQRLGFGGAPVRRKSVRYSTPATPEKFEHVFAVVLDREPVGLVLLAAGAGDEKGTGRMTFFKMGMDGTLARAIRIEGDVRSEDAPVVELALDAKGTRDEFESEVAFYRTDAPKLAWESEKEEG